MTQPLVRTGRVFAATALLGALMIGAPSFAQTAGTPSASTNSGSTGTPAPQISTPAARPMTKATASTASVTDRAEQHIADLHKKLKITQDQEPKWTEVAQTMRDNAQKMDALIQQRHDGLKGMTAVDDLRSYRDIADQHAKSLEQLITAFQGLYDSMTPAQQKNADMVFAQVQGPSKIATRTSKGS